MEAIKALTVHSRCMLTSSSSLKKEKRKRKLEVVGGEGDENGDVKTKEKWFWNR